MCSFSFNRLVIAISNKKCFSMLLLFILSIQVMFIRHHDDTRCGLCFFEGVQFICSDGTESMKYYCFYIYKINRSIQKIKARTIMATRMLLELRVYYVMMAKLITILNPSLKMG